jgi:hypothetical protein
MRPYGSPSEFMDQLKLRSMRRRKEQYRRRNTVFLFLGILMIGIIICFAVIGTPMLNYFLPQTGTYGNAGTSKAPSVSMNSYLESAGMDASGDLKIMNGVVHKDGSRSWFVGIVKNTGKKSYKGSTVYYDLYDSGGQSLGSTYAFVGEIRPGDHKDFSTNPIKGVASTAVLKYVIGS